MIKKEEVSKALDDLGQKLDEENISKASEQDLDQPEGADLGGGHMKDKMSDKAPPPDKSKKAKKSESAEDEQEKEMETKKSYGEDLPEEITTKIEVSDFLRSLVDHTGEAVDNLRSMVLKSDEVHQDRYDTLCDAIEEVQKSQAKVGTVLKAICERIGVIENAPAHEPKSETTVKSDQPVERKFENPEDDGDKPEPMFKSLNANPLIAKAQVSDAICSLVKKGEAKDTDVITFETVGHIRPEVAAALKQVLN